MTTVSWEIDFNCWHVPAKMLQGFSRLVWWLVSGVVWIHVECGGGGIMVVHLWHDVFLIFFSLNGCIYNYQKQPKRGVKYRRWIMTWQFDLWIFIQDVVVDTLISCSRCGVMCRKVWLLVAAGGGVSSSPWVSLGPQSPAGGHRGNISLVSDGVEC